MRYTPVEGTAEPTRSPGPGPEFLRAILAVRVLELVLLRDQDRTTWDRSMIEEVQAIVRARIRRDRPGPYQIQAAIQAVHCDADSSEANDWSQIVSLYDQLFPVMPPPVVALNRAIAIAEVDGPNAALAILDAIAPHLESYHLLNAAPYDAAPTRTKERSSSGGRALHRPRRAGSGASVPGGPDRGVDVAGASTST